MLVVAIPSNVVVAVQCSVAVLRLVGYDERGEERMGRMTHMMTRNKQRTCCEYVVRAYSQVVTGPPFGVVYFS